MEVIYCTPKIVYARCPIFLSTAKFIKFNINNTFANMYASIILLIALIGVATAFQSVGGRVNTRSLKMYDSDRSIALPFDKRPENLDGTLPGDVGFDPAGFTNNPPKIFGEESSLKWYREAEIVHGRIAQLAVLGNLVQGVWHLPGNPAFGVAADAYSATNPFTALSQVPSGALWQISLVIFGIEINRIKRIIKGDKNPGDLGLGQTGFNPFGFKYTPEEYYEKQVQEIKHGRLAMFGAIGILLQASISGVGVDEQLSGAFTFPDATAVVKGTSELADFFPAGL